MNVVVTGTPGTGKTTAVETLRSEGLLPESYSVLHLNDLIESENLYTTRDQQRDSVIADLDAVRDRVAGTTDLVIESHLAHHLSADRVVVLRCHPEQIYNRLRERGEPVASAEENAESEALDVILSETVQQHGADSVFEIETTQRSPADVAAQIRAVIDGTKDPCSGTVSYIDYLDT